MLAKILSQRHGFTCTVIFAMDPDGTINPNNTASSRAPRRSTRRMRSSSSPASAIGPTIR